MNRIAKIILAFAMAALLTVSIPMAGMQAVRAEAAPIAPATQIPDETPAPEAAAEEAEAEASEETEATEAEATEAEAAETEAAEAEAAETEAEAEAAEAPALTVPADAVILTVGDRTFTAEDVDSMAYMMYSQGRVETYPDYDKAVESLTQEAVLEYALETAGYTQFTDEEQAAFAAEAESMMEAALNRYVEHYLTEDTEEARAQLYAQAQEYYAARGATLDVVTENLRFEAAAKKLDAELTGGYVPTEDEITEVFNTQGAMYQQQYENNVPMYEFLTQYYGYESWYVPEGYRSVIHILLEVEDEVLQAYTAAQAALDEAQSAETVDEAAVDAAQTALDEAFDAVIASRQDTIDEISSRLAQGESFQDLIAEYGTDPGMKNEATLAEGYHVHPESIVWDPAFVSAAFQDGMQQPGDVSEPVVGSYGIHILYYLKDVPGGLIMTDAIRDEISEYLVTSKLNDAYNAFFEEWSQKLEITRDDALLEQLKVQAEAALKNSGSEE